jgi:hypothetical protein
MRSEPATDKEGSGIIRVTLMSEQRELLNPVLDKAKLASGLEGVFCSLSRAYSPAASCTTLELQCVALTKPAPGSKSLEADSFHRGEHNTDAMNAKPRGLTCETCKTSHGFVRESGSGEANRESIRLFMKLSWVF